MTMRTGILILASLAMGGAVIGFVPRQTPTTTKDQAAGLARKFLKLAGLPDPKQPPSVKAMPPSSVFRDRWEVVFSGEYRLTVLHNDGMVGSFQNQRRIEEQFKGKQDRSVRRFTSANQAASHLHALATKFGLRPQAKRTKLEYVNDGDPKKTDSNRAGRIHVQYRTKPFGYAFFPPEMGNGMGLTIDPVDGALVSFAQSWDIKIESHTLGVSKTRAIAKAEAVFRPYRKKHRSFHTTADEPVGKVELGYVLPNPAYGSKHPNPTTEKLARLAYIVYFGVETVWIDAATGKLLGGQSFA